MFFKKNRPQKILMCFYQVRSKIYHLVCFLRIGVSLQDMALRTICVFIPGSASGNLCGFDARQSGSSIPCDAVSDMASEAEACHVWHGMPSSRPRCHHIIRPRPLLMPCPTWCARCVLWLRMPILFYTVSFKDLPTKGATEVNGSNLDMVVRDQIALNMMLPSPSPTAVSLLQSNSNYR